MYGKELIIDMHGCYTDRMNRKCIDDFFSELCEKIDMVQCERYWWDDEETPDEERQTSPHTTGVTAVQFILTSNITIHTLPLLRKVFLNVFSCKDFKNDIVQQIALNHFKGYIVNSVEVNRL